MPKDFYHTLGLPKGATEQDVKKSYRKLAMQWHPDKHKGDKTAEQKFKEINEAYEVLSDPQKRASYDQFGTANFGAGGSSGGGGGGFSSGGFDFGGFSGESGFSDIFESFFGGQRGGSRRRGGAIPGDDLETVIQLTFEEAAFGTEKELSLTKMMTCEHCEGKGAEKGSSIVTCKTCGGTGEVRVVRQTILGQIATSSFCETCRGEGRIPEKPCNVCQGRKRVRGTERVKVKIPAGIDHGSSIRLTDKGEAGVSGGKNGDLYIHIEVSLHKKFKRDGADVYSEQSIHLLQAVLGDEVQIDTLHGVTTLKIPAGTQSEKVFRLREQGIPFLKKEGTGDHYVKIIVNTPQKLTKKERDLYMELAKESGLSVKNDKSFFKNLGL